MTIYAAIPGQPTDYRSAPEGEYAAAIARLEKLSRSFDTQGFEVQLEDALFIRAWSKDEIVVWIGESRLDLLPYTRALGRAIHWRWGALLYDDESKTAAYGWHPDHNFFALTKSGQRLFRDTMGQPGPFVRADILDLFVSDHNARGDALSI